MTKAIYRWKSLFWLRTAEGKSLSWLRGLAAGCKPWQQMASLVQEQKAENSHLNHKHEAESQPEAG